MREWCSARQGTSTLLLELPGPLIDGLFTQAEAIRQITNAAPLINDLSGKLESKLWGVGWPGSFGHK